MLSGRKVALAKINLLSALAQIVQIGAITPLLSLTLEAKGASSLHIGIIVSASWIAILLLYKFVPRILNTFGVVRSNTFSAFLSIFAVLGMSVWTNGVALFSLNFLLGMGLIIRWIACDTWIIAVAEADGRGRAVGVHETLMGLGIALGPLIISLFGILNSTAYKALAIMLLLSALTALSLKKYDIYPAIPKHSKGSLLRLIPIAFFSAFLAGFSETSCVSFLGVYAVSIGYLVAQAALIVSAFGVGGTALQLPIGFMSDKSSYRKAQLVCYTVALLAAALTSFASLNTLTLVVIVFFWGGAVGGMNTLAVIEAGNTIPEHGISTAMTLIAMCYTSGSFVGPVITGALMSVTNNHGLISTGVIVAAGIALLLTRLGK